MNDQPHHPQNHGPRDHDDERLRRLLEDAVTDVEPREGLESIHARLKVTSMNRKRPWLLAAGAAVVATAATVAAVTVLTDDTSPVSDEPGFAASSPAHSAEPTPTPKQKESAEPTEQPSAEASPPKTPEVAMTTATVPVYYAGETSRGPRLYREFHRVDVRGDDTLSAALTEALAGSPADRDYRTDWPSGTKASGEYDGDTITVDLAGEGLDSRPGAMGRAAANIAVEQLVYTAQAAVQDRAPVRFLLDGKPTNRLLGVPVAEPVSEGDAADVLGQVWIIEPQEGASVTVPIKVSGLAAAFEANVQWELRKGGKVVKSGFTTAEECCTMAPYSFRIKGVKSGTYTLVVHDTDPSGGEGFSPWRDTKTITVR